MRVIRRGAAAPGVKRLYVRPVCLEMSKSLAGYKTCPYVSMEANTRTQRWSRGAKRLLRALLALRKVSLVGFRQNEPKNAKAEKADNTQIPGRGVGISGDVHQSRANQRAGTCKRSQ